jgi:putative ABC transport system ATP-binding protein
MIVSPRSAGEGGVSGLNGLAHASLQPRVGDEILCLDSVRFRWPAQEIDCLDIERFSLQAGGHCFLSGPSGSGKSTLLALLGGVVRPQGGRIHLLGHDITALEAASRDRLRGDHIGFIFQQFNLIPHLPLLDNVMLPCRFSSRRRQCALAQSATLAAEAGRLLGRLALEPELWRRPPTTLSVGQQQRVAAARALIGRPELIIADEPTSALDAALQLSFIDLLLEECAQAGSTLLFVSHDQRLAVHFPRQLTLTDVNAAPGGGR